MITGKRELFLIRREGIIGRPAQAERRGVVISRRQVAGFTALRRDDKDVAARPVLPGFPVTKQQAISDVCFHFALRFLFGAFLIAGVVVALGVNVGSER